LPEARIHPIIPKSRRKKLYRQLRQRLGQVSRQLTQQKGSQILEGPLVVGHVRVLISVPPRYAVAQAIGSIKGESAIRIARTVGRGGRTSQESILGSRVLRVYRRPRREGDSPVHPATGTSGSPPGPDKNVGLTTPVL
jgi:REP element-mobilizing transposase RayT